MAAKHFGGCVQRIASLTIPRRGRHFGGMERKHVCLEYCAVRGTLCLLMVAVAWCVCTPALATITFSSNTLTYSSPSDLGTTIDPSGLNTVATSYGVTKASFQALNPKVVAFNGAPTPSQTLRTLVVTYKTGCTATFAFPSVMYNYGSMSSLGRGAFSGSSLQDAISTVPNQPDSLYNWFDASIATTGSQGVQSIGFCAAFRNDQAVPAGQVLFTLSDSTTGSVTLPALGGSGNPQYVFVGYTAPTGKTITRVQASRTSTPGGGYVTIDDLSLVMSPDTTPPAAVSNLSCSNLTTTSVQLNWTAPGDDGSTGTATSYDIRYSTSAITAGNFSSATQVSGGSGPGGGRDQSERDRLGPDSRYNVLLCDEDGGRGAELVDDLQRAQRAHRGLGRAGGGQQPVLQQPDDHEHPIELDGPGRQWQQRHGHHL